MLCSYPWYARMPLVGCFSLRGRAMRLMFKAEQHFLRRDYHGAQQLFGRAAALATRLADLPLELLCGLGLARVLRSWGLPDRALETLDAILPKLKKLLDSGELAEDILQLRHDLVESRTEKAVFSKLKVARMAGALAEELSPGSIRTSTWGEPTREQQMLDEALELVVRELGYRHWLTAYVFCAMAREAQDGGQSDLLLSRAHHIALEYPDRAGDVLAAVREGLDENDGHFTTP